MAEIFVTGGQGLVGSALARQGGIGLSRSQLDICNFAMVEKFICERKPHAVINAAAQANVNLADVEIERSFLVNGEAVRNLAKVCQKYQVRLVHISTDYVLDSPKDLLEDFPTNPRSTYAESKLLGEQAALAHDAVVVRVQWVYRPGYPNFFTKALQRLHRQQKLTLVYDQIGSPTYVNLLAKGLLLCANQGATGLFHLACQGEATAEQWIASAAKMLDLPLVYERGSRLDFPGPYRPKRSCLNSDKFFATWGFRLPDWQQALKQGIQDCGRAWLD